MDMIAIFFLLAIILFVVAAVGVSTRINLTAAGLAALATALFLAAGGIS